MTLGVATAGPFLINVTLLSLNIFFFRAGLAVEVTEELLKAAGMKVASRKSKDRAIQCTSKTHSGTHDTTNYAYTGYARKKK